MDRKQFLKQGLLGLAACSIAPTLLTKGAEPVFNSITLPVKVFPTYFKISSALYNDIEAIDKLSISIFGTPFKELGYMDDDFAEGMLTVRPFAKDGSNDCYREEDN